MLLSFQQRPGQHGALYEPIATGSREGEEGEETPTILPIEDVYQIPPPAQRWACGADRVQLRDKFNEREINADQLICKYDREGNRKIAADDLQQLLNDFTDDIWTRATAEDAKCIFLIADVNNDGSIDASEIAFGIQTWYAFVHMPSKTLDVVFKSSGIDVLPDARNSCDELTIHQILEKLNGHQPVKSEEARFVVDTLQRIMSQKAVGSRKSGKFSTARDLRQAIAAWYLNIERGETNTHDLMDFSLEVPIFSDFEKAMRCHNAGMSLCRNIIAAAPCSLVLWLPAKLPTCEYDLHGIILAHVHLFLAFLVTNLIVVLIDLYQISGSRILKFLGIIRTVLAFLIVAFLPIISILCLRSTPAKCGASLYTCAIVIYVWLPISSLCICCCGCLFGKRVASFLDKRAQDAKVAQQRKEEEAERQKISKHVKHHHAKRLDDLKRSMTGSLEAASSSARVESWVELLQVQALDNDVKNSDSFDPELLETLWEKCDADKSGVLEKHEVRVVLLEFAKAKRIVLEENEKGAMWGRAFEIRQELQNVKRIESDGIQNDELDIFFAECAKGNDGGITKARFLESWPKLFFPEMVIGAAEKAKKDRIERVKRKEIIDQFKVNVLTSFDDVPSLNKELFARRVEQITREQLSNLFQQARPHARPERENQAAAFRSAILASLNCVEVASGLDKILELVFSLLDSNRNGLVEKAEVEDFFEVLSTIACFKEGWGDMASDIAFRFVDKNKDDIIIVEEVLGLIDVLAQVVLFGAITALDLIDSVATSIELQSLFMDQIASSEPWAFLDTDLDGAISREEFTAALANNEVPKKLAQLIESQLGDRNQVAAVWNFAKDIRSYATFEVGDGFVSTALMTAAAWMDLGMDESAFTEKVLPLMKDQIDVKFDVTESLLRSGDWSNFLEGEELPQELRQFIEDRQVTEFIEKARPILIATLALTRALNRDHASDICKLIFFALDLDNSGRVTAKNIATVKALIDGVFRVGSAILIKSGSELSDAEKSQIEAICPDLLSDEEGSVNLENEITALFMAVFETVDRDGDGKIQREELVGFLSKMISFCLQLKKIGIQILVQTVGMLIKGAIEVGAEEVGVQETTRESFPEQVRQAITWMESHGPSIAARGMQLSAVVERLGRQKLQQLNF